MKKEALEKIVNGHKLLQEGYAELAECFISAFTVSTEEVDTVIVKETLHDKEDKPAKEEAPKVTVEDVRAVLAVKTRDGKTQKVKALLNEFGAEKLSSVPEDKLADLKAKAEVL